MTLFTTLVTSYIWPGTLPFSRATTISTAAALEINLLQSLVDWLFNEHSVCLRKWRLVLRLFFAGSRLPSLWIQKISVFSRSLLYKLLTRYEILLWYDINVTHTKFLDKTRKLLVLMYIPQTEYGVITILKYASDVTYVIRLEGPGTLNALILYQYFCTAICNVLSEIYF